jgi:hypothetical protein
MICAKCGEDAVPMDGTCPRCGDTWAQVDPVKPGAFEVKEGGGGHGLTPPPAPWEFWIPPEPPTLRDRFAMAAKQPPPEWYLDLWELEHVDGLKGAKGRVALRAGWAYFYADAMLEARKPKEDADDGR